MSWILKRKKKIVFCATVAVLFSALCCVEYFVWHSSALVCATFISLISVALMNRAVLKKMHAAHAPFRPLSRIRNVDFLVIGTFIDARSFIPKGKSFVQIAAPGRGLFSAYQVLRHTHSILKEEGGTVMLAFEKGKDKFTVFDMPFLHPVTVKKYHLEGLKRESRFPMIFAPINSVRSLITRGGVFPSFASMTKRTKSIQTQQYFAENAAII